MTVLRQTFSIFQRSLSSFPRASHGVPSHPICRPLTAHVSRTRTRAFSSSLGRLQDKVLPHFDSSPSTPDAPVAASLAASPEPRTQVKFEAPEPRLSLAFTCAVEGCSTRSTHQFTKRSYERGIVIVQCPGCKNRCVSRRCWLICSAHSC